MRNFGIALALLVAAIPGAMPHAHDGSIKLNVKPVLCITDRRNPSCEMSLLIVWQSPVEGDFCLYSDFGPRPIVCWAMQASGRIEEARQVNTPFRYWLTNGDSGLRLAEATVDVVSADLEDRRRARRNRHAWSVL